MLELVKQSIASQFEAALCMVYHPVRICRTEHWEGKIAQSTFRQMAYHTLFFADLYLSPSESTFELRDVHSRGGEGRRPELSNGLSQQETQEYADFCRQKAITIIAGETETSLAGPSGFSWRKTSRLEHHLYNIRHIQHHAGAFSAFLRRIGPSICDDTSIPWVGEGWK